MRKDDCYINTFDDRWWGPRLLTILFISVLLVLISGPAQAEKKLQMDKGQPIQIQSDRLDAYQEERVVIFSGNAVATQGDRTIKADRMLIYYRDRTGSPQKKNVSEIGAAGDLERLEAQGRVTIIETNRIVTGDQAVFYQDSQKIVMTGNAVMQEGKNVIKGGKIIVFLDEDRGVVESGESKRVTATIYPNEKKVEKKK